MNDVRYDVLKCTGQIGCCELLKSFEKREDASDYIQKIKGEVEEHSRLVIYELKIDALK